MSVSVSVCVCVCVCDVGVACVGVSCCFICYVEAPAVPTVCRISIQHYGITDRF